MNGDGIQRFHQTSSVLSNMYEASVAKKGVNEVRSKAATPFCMLERV